MDAANEPAIPLAPDPLYDEAIWLVVSEQNHSVSLLVDRLKVGGERAADLLRRMSDELILAPTGTGGAPLILADSYEGIQRMVEATWNACREAVRRAPKAQDAEAQVVALWAHFELERAKAASALPSALARAHRFVSERERERQFQQWKAARYATAPQGVPVTAPPSPPGSRGAGVAGTVIRTAVRATVWESIRALFRSL